MILTLTTFLPLVGAMAIMALRVVGGADMASGASKGISILTSLVTLAASLVALSQFDANAVGYQLVELRAVVWRFVLQAGRRRSCDLAGRADDRADAAVHPAVDHVDQDSAGGIHDRLPDPRDADDRRVLRARPRAVLRVLRRRPDPDVPDHRRVGRQEQAVRRVQVLPLHAARIAAAAGRAGLHVDRRRHDGCGGSAGRAAARNRGAAIPAGSADLAVAGVLRVVRGEAADVAGAHMVARCARRGADGWLGGAGGRAAEDGRLRLPAVLAADVPGSVDAVPAADVCAERDRDRLRVAGRVPADGHQEADGLFVGRAHGLRHARHLLVQRGGHPGRASSR